jgi:hypothetical protein
MMKVQKEFSAVGIGRAFLIVVARAMGDFLAKLP